MPPLNPNVQQEISPDGVPLSTGTITPAPPTPSEGKTSTTPPSQQQPTLPKEEQVTPAKETSTEKTETPEVDFTQFLAVKDVNTKKEEKTPSKKEVEKPVVEKPAEVEQPKENARDYSDLDEADVPLFQRMSNDAFNKLKPVYKEHKQLQQQKKELEQQLTELRQKGPQLPDSYYEHPDGFVLTPEFAHQSNRVQQASAIVQHWQNQLAAIREGATKVRDIAIDQKTGDISEGKEVVADAAVEGRIINQLSMVNAQLMNEQNALNNIVVNHRSRYQQNAQWAEQFAQQAFQIFYKPESENLRKVVDDTINNLPAVHRKNPLARVLAMSLVTNNQLGRLLQSQQKNGAAAVVTKTTDGKVVDPTEQKKAGPTSSEVGGGNSGKASASEVTFDDFVKVKAGL